MYPFSQNNFQESITYIRSNKIYTAKFIEMICQYEKDFYESGINIRELVTGPLVDRIYESEINSKKVIEKKIDKGSIIAFKYTSRIARDFLMSPTEIPDHVNEPQTTKLISRIIKKKIPKNIILGGAYFGDMAIPIEREIKNNKISTKIHCFEANDEQRKLLKRNILKNKCRNIYVYGNPLYNRNNIVLSLESRSDSHGRIGQKNRFETKIRNKSITIDKFQKNKINGSNIGLIHLDIEGSELKAFIGAEKLLSLDENTAPDLIFEYCTYFNKEKNRVNKAEIVSFLERLDYKLFAIRDYSSNIGVAMKTIEIIPIRKIFQKDVPHCFNILGTKKLDNINKYKLKIVENVHPKLLYHEEADIHSPLS